MKLILKPFHSLRSKNYSISKRIMVTSLFLVLLPLIFTGVYGYYIYSSQMENVTVRYSKQILFPLKKQLEETFKQLDSSITPIWLDGDLQQLINIPSEQWVNDPRKTINIKKNISDILGWQQSVEGLFIITSDNGVLHDVISSPVDIHYPFEKEEFFIKSKDVKNSFVSGPSRQNYINGDLVFSITRSLRSIPTFKWRGAIHLDIDANKIFNIFKSVDIGKKGFIAAVDSKGRFVFHPDQSLIGEKVDFPYYSKIAHQKESGNFYITEAGIEQLVIFDKSEYLDWTLVSIVPKSELNHGAVVIRNMVLLVGTVTLLIMFLAIWKINNITFQPLRQINKAIIGLGYGDFSSKLEPIRIVELQSVVNQYNQTVDKLKNLTEKLYITKIKQHQSEIEAQQHLLLKQEAELRQREAELGQLEAQINPHFLYNTLSCIQSLAELEESEKIDRVVGLLSKLLRYSLAQYISKVKIKEELEHVMIFVEIQQIRHEDHIKVIWDIDENVLDDEINRLTVQPLVENAYFHGVEPLVEEGRIYIIIKKIQEGNHEKLYICVEDNGIGMDEQKLEELNQFIRQYREKMEVVSSDKGESTPRLSGVKNVIKRLFLVYGNSCNVTIDSKKNEGTRIQIYISDL